MKKVNISLKKGFVCNDKDCKSIFFNSDDNVCIYCGSKNTKRIYKARLTGEVEDY